MNFAEAWDALAIDDVVTVSDGTAPPSNSEGMHYRCWRSHNFTGVLKAKTGTAPYRQMDFELEWEGNVRPAFGVSETVAHTFT